MKTFVEAVIELWAELRLPAPRMSAGNSVVLSVDGMDIGLRETEDEQHVLVRSTIGQLSDDPGVQVGQLDWILKTNLGLVLGCEACLSLEDAATGTTFIVGEAVHDLRTGGTRHLMERIDNVIVMTETYYGRLNDPRTMFARGASVPDATDAEAETMIFRP